MSQFHLDCSPELAQRFWALCRKRGTTAGQAIRVFMAEEVERATGAMIDPSIDSNSPAKVDRGPLK